MHEYNLVCAKCGFTIIDPQDCDYRDEGDGERRFPRCPECDQDYMHHVVHGIDATCQEHVRYSWSMGCHVEQIPQMMKQYPGSEYHPQTGQLKINSRAHKRSEMKRRGYEEY